MSGAAAQSETHRKGLIDPAHCRIIQAAHLFPQTLFIYGTDLLQQHHRIPGKAAASGRKIDMGGQFGFILPAGDGSSDHSGTVTVAHIVLHNQYRTDTALL